MKRVSQPYAPGGTVYWTTYTYDGLGRTTAVQSPDGVSTTTYSYQGNATTVTDPAGKWKTYATDAMGNLAQVIEPNPAGGNLISNYTYDAINHLTQVTTKRLKSTNNASQVASLTTSQSYTNEGRISSVTYPSAFDGSGNTLNGPTYTYTYDTVSRPIKLTDNQSVDWAKDGLYGPANELTQISFSSNGTGSYYTETRAYNTRLQLTRMTVPGVMDMEYRYSTNQNNGQITQQKDWVSGEEVTYAYDGISRLISAVTTDSAWGLSFGYDGFGNRTSSSVTKGSAPNSSLNFDGATNRILGSGFSYDANGNMTAMPSVSSISYDVENRAASMTTGSGTEQYGYGPDGKRIWKKMPNGTEEFYFFGITGQKLGTYRAGTGPNGYGMFVLDTNLYFGNKLLRSRGTTVVTDRQGSVRASGAISSRYFPYGEEQQVTAQDREKFDGSYRDASTGLDYGKRYYANSVGVFLTPNWSKSCGTAQNPGSWNRYSFMGGDPEGNSIGMVRIDETGRFDDTGSKVTSYVTASLQVPVPQVSPAPTQQPAVRDVITQMDVPAGSPMDSLSSEASAPGIPGAQMAQLAQQSRSTSIPSINPTTIWTPQTGYIVPGYGASPAQVNQRAAVAIPDAAQANGEPCEIRCASIFATSYYYCWSGCCMGFVNGIYRDWSNTRKLVIFILCKNDDAST